MEEGGGLKRAPDGGSFFSASFYHALLAYWVYGDTGGKEKRMAVEGSSRPPKKWPNFEQQTFPKNIFGH